MYFIEGGAPLETLAQVIHRNDVFLKCSSNTTESGAFLAAETAFCNRRYFSSASGAFPRWAQSQKVHASSYLGLVLFCSHQGQRVAYYHFYDFENSRALRGC
jgi:hypothetical protein